MSPIEIATLGKLAKTGFLIRMILLLAVALLIGGWMLERLIGYTLATGDYWGILLWGSLIVCSIGAAGRKVTQNLIMRRKIGKDLQSGNKKVTETFLEKKWRVSPAFLYKGKRTKYYALLAGQEFKLSGEQWERLKENQLIQIHMASYSGYVFSITT